MTENVKIEVPYEQALRLSYMARFPEHRKPEDKLLADTIDEAIARAETGSGGSNETG